MRTQTLDVGPCLCRRVSRARWSGGRAGGWSGRQEGGRRKGLFSWALGRTEGAGRRRAEGCGRKCLRFVRHHLGAQFRGLFGAASLSIRLRLRVRHRLRSRSRCANSPLQFFANFSQLSRVQISVLRTRTHTACPPALSLAQSQTYIPLSLSDSVRQASSCRPRPLAQKSPRPLATLHPAYRSLPENEQWHARPSLSFPFSLPFAYTLSSHLSSSSPPSSPF